jgi:aminoglycoside phosphotransferase (APT) family kinase protein
MTPGELRERLERFLARAADEPDARVEAVRQLAGGASRQIWAFDAVFQRAGASVRRPLVLRRDPGGSALNMGRRDEFRVHRAAFAEGVPVPEPLWLADDAEPFGAPSYIMERVDGETLPRRLLRDDAYAAARGVMVGQRAAILARIHRIDLTRHGLDALPSPPIDVSPALAELDRYEQAYRSLAPEPHPAFELTLRWLRRHLPVGGARTLVHGDYRIGNVVFGPDGVRAMLDWELAHIGDPAEDLGWLCVRAWRFGRDDHPVGGIGSRAELFAAYERAGGAPVDAERVRFWEVFGNLKWAIICVGQARTHLEGLVRSVELAALGRRTAETEWELLNLIEGVD